MSGIIKTNVSSEQFTFEFVLAKFRALNRSMESIGEEIGEVARKVTYVENVIRYHEDEDGCEHDH